MSPIRLATIAALCLAPAGAPAIPTDAEVAARSAALDLAAAFSNDGFKLRDGHQTATVEKNKPLLFEVNLFAGNEYWFAAAASGKTKKLAVTILDETGRPIDAEPFGDEGAPRAAAGFAPAISGPYFIKVESVEGEPDTLCLVYCYK
jgi:hypothetical protein